VIGFVIHHCGFFDIIIVFTISATPSDQWDIVHTSELAEKQAWIARRQEHPQYHISKANPVPSLGFPPKQPGPLDTLCSQFCFCCAFVAGY
jgi:hypothetical protein